MKWLQTKRQSLWLMQQLLVRQKWRWKWWMEMELQLLQKQKFLLLRSGKSSTLFSFGLCGFQQVSLCRYTPTSAGWHAVDVKYCGRDVPGSPFSVSVCDPKAVRAYGPGLEKATAKREARFTVDASDAGSGSLGLVVSGPAESKITCEEASPGKYEVCYVPPRPGVYNVDLKFSGEDVEGSVFSVPCEALPPDASKCVVTGLDNPGSFTVDCSEAGGTGSLEVGVCGAYVPAEFVSVKHNGDYTFSVTYDIPEPGETQISVKWHDQHLTGSPFTVITQ